MLRTAITCALALGLAGAAAAQQSGTMGTDPMAGTTAVQSNGGAHPNGEASGMDSSMSGKSSKSHHMKHGKTMKGGTDAGASGAGMSDGMSNMNNSATPGSGPHA